MIPKITQPQTYKKTWLGLIFRRGECWGLNLFQWRNLSAAIWYIPKGVHLPVHRHPGQHMELVLLWGDTRTMIAHRCRKDGEEESKPARKFEPLTTPDGYYHWVTGRTSAIVYVNFIRWIGGRYRPPQNSYLNFYHE